jgi:hypothetical protein
VRWVGTRVWVWGGGRGQMGPVETRGYKWAVYGGGVRGGLSGRCTGQTAARTCRRKGQRKGGCMHKRERVMSRAQGKGGAGGAVPVLVKGRCRCW